MQTNFEDLPVDEQNKLLRAYQFGKSDIDPRNGMTRAENLKHYKEIRANYEAGLVAKAVADKAGVVTNKPVTTNQLPDEKALGELSKVNLVEQSASEGLDLVGDETKAEIVDKILTHRQKDSTEALAETPQEPATDTA